MRQSWKFLIFPFLFAVYATNFATSRGPYWLGPNSDPNYAYMLNSLSIVQLKEPRLTDHPGTPVQVLGAPVILATYLLSDKQSKEAGLVFDVIKNPEKYLVNIQRVNLFFILFSIYLVGVYSFLLFKSLSGSLLLQAAPFLTYSALLAATQVAPEPFLFLTAQFIIIVLLFCLSRGFNMSYATLLGLLVGFGITSKITFLPFAFLIFIFPKFKMQLRFFLASVLSAFICTLPIIKHGYRAFWQFTSGVVTHTGIYGNGKKGIIDTQNIDTNLMFLVDADPTFFALLLLYAIIIFYFFRKNRWQLSDSLMRISLSVLLVCAVQTLIVIKHPGDIRYMLPAMSLAGFLCFVLLLFSKNQKQLTYIVFAMALVCISFGVVKSTMHIKTVQINIMDVEKIREFIKKDYAQCQIAYHYTSSSYTSAYQFDRTTGWAHKELLIKIHGDLLLYDLVNRNFIRNQVGVGREELIKNSCLLMQGTPFEGARAPYRPDFKIETIYPGAVEALYKVLP